MMVGPFLSHRALSSKIQKPRFAVLDLRGAGLSIIERLCLEEFLLRKDPVQRQWIIWGTHHASLLPATTSSPCMVVMGIGGKPHQLLNVDLVRKHQVPVIKRFSGGGTVVVDDKCIYTTIIGRTDQLSHVSPYPREIMAWTAETVFGPAFSQLKHEATENAGNSHATFPDFELKENDYILGSSRKVGGNAQSIVKGGWLHHTTFLWDYLDQNMQYLTLPEKRPDYRKDRDHSEFLIKLKEAYDNRLTMDHFFHALNGACDDAFDVEHVTFPQVMAIMEDVAPDGIQQWFETESRTKIVDLSSSTA